MILPEIVAAGIYDSKIAFKNVTVTKKRKTSMFEIELPIESGGISYINLNSMEIRPNMVICAKPEQTRNTKFPFKCFYVHMIIHSGLLYDVLMNTPDFFETKNFDTYERIFKTLIMHSNSPSANEEIILQSLVLELVYTISRDTHKINRNNKTGENRSIIEDSLKYIKENLTEDLSLEKLSNKMALSPSYFHNVFRSSVSKTLRDYVEEQRIKKAINLLQTTNYSLTRIAYECGFSSQSYFSYVFKRKMKQTPREYVKTLYNKYEL